MQIWAIKKYGCRGYQELIQASSPHPAFLQPSSAPVLTVIHPSLQRAGRITSEAEGGLKEGLELPRKHQPAQCQLLSIPLGCVHAQQWGTVLALQAYIYISNRLSNKLPCTCMVHLQLAHIVHRRQHPLESRQLLKGLLDFRHHTALQMGAWSSEFWDLWICTDPTFPTSS